MSQPSLKDPRNLRALAALLSYPDQAMRQSLPELLTWAVHCPDVGPHRAAMCQFIDTLLASDEYSLQSEYVDTFDRGRSTCLNLFEHVHGDSRDRGQAMVDLHQLYRNAGLIANPDELPDYLPSFLEFASTCPRDEAIAHLSEVSEILQAIHATLVRRNNPYQAVFATLLDCIGQPVALASSTPAKVEEDNTPQAIDAAWLDAPVTFMGNCAPGSSAAEQPLNFVRKVA